MASKQKLDALLNWFDDNKIQWSKDILEVRDINGSFGVYAKKNMKKGRAVVKIPKESILSIKTTGIANILDEANLEGGCPLALALLYELAVKEQSPWYGYLQSLPEKGADIPVFWTEEEKALLKGTEMENALENDLNDLKDDYEELIKPLLYEHPYIFIRDESKDPYSFDEFLRVSSLISSRAFEVDAYHENALVPFADLFNHRSEGEHVHFESEFDVCDACGGEYCEHRYFECMDNENDDNESPFRNNEEENEEDWEDEEDAESMEMDTELPDLEKMEEEGINFYDSDSEEEEDEVKDTCDIVLDRDIKKGEEVFNTYGDLPNIALLSKYGFCYDDNKNDYLSVDENTLVECCIGITADMLKDKFPDASEDEVQKEAVKLIRPRWEFFMQHEHILCPDPNEETLPDDYEDDDCGSNCGHDHGHGHEHQHGENCEHDHDQSHTDEEEEEEDEECTPEKSRPYYINWEGLFEDKVMCCLHIMFSDDETFASFSENVEHALAYFENLANSQGQNTSQALTDVKSKVYKACRTLAEIRKLDYDGEKEWKPVKEEVKERDQLMYPSDDEPINMRKYYAMTCRISEKKIVEKCIAYYSKMIKECSGSGSTTTKNKKKPAKKNKKVKTK